MEALIVAAGFGSRLSAVSRSKPLTPVAGKAMIVRVIEAARAGGASGVTVVTGHLADEVEAFLDGFDPSVRCVRTEDWTRPNGHSVLTGAEIIGPAPHLLMMADHLIEPALVRGLIAAPGTALRLAVDRRLDDPRVDLDDVTRVLAPDGTIVAIGKQLDVYDAFDCGVFVVDGRYHAALRQLAGTGVASISAGVEALARTGDAHAWTIGERWWLDVDDPRALAHAEGDLAAHANVAVPLH